MYLYLRGITAAERKRSSNRRSLLQRCNCSTTAAVADSSLSVFVEFSTPQSWVVLHEYQLVIRRTMYYLYQYVLLVLLVACSKKPCTPSLVSLVTRPTLATLMLPVADKLPGSAYIPQVN